MALNHRKLKTTGKSAIPSLNEDQTKSVLSEMRGKLNKPRPFTLPNHLVVSRRGYDEDRIFSDCEIVSDLGEQLILRSPEVKRPARVPVRSKKQKDESAMDAVLFYTSPNKDAPLQKAVKAISELLACGDFIQIRTIAERALTHLAVYARAGNKEARQQFVGIVHTATEGLSEMTRARPKDLIPLACGVARWPLMKSTRAESSDPDYLLRAIKLGSALPVNFTKKAKWKDDYASFVAGELQKYLHDMRESEFKRGVFSDGKTYLMKEVIPPLRKDTALRLWYFAEQILLQSYPKPNEVAELAKICTSPSWQKPPSRKVQGILNAIKARFLNMPK